MDCLEGEGEVKMNWFFFMYITVASSASLITVKIIVITENMQYRYSLLALGFLAADLPFIAILHGEASPEITTLLRGRRSGRFVSVAGLVIRILGTGRLSGRRSTVSRIPVTVRPIFLQTCKTSVYYKLQRTSFFSLKLRTINYLQMNLTF